MNHNHDMMRGSQAWDRLSNGVRSGVVDPDVRQMFHDIANVMTILVAATDRALNEIDRQAALADKEHRRIHDRIDRRGQDHEALKTELMHPTKGEIAQTREYVNAKFGKLLAWAGAIAGAVIVAALGFLLFGGPK